MEKVHKFSLPKSREKFRTIKIISEQTPTGIGFKDIFQPE